MRVLFLLIFSTLTVISFAYANTPATPDKKPSLKAIEKNLSAEKKQEKKLKKQAKELEGALKDTKSRLIDISRKIQKNEKTLQTLNIKIEDLETEQGELQASLKTDQKSIARLILALERIRRVPPEALIAKPGAPLKTAQSAMLMQDIIPALNTQAENLRKNLETLEAVSKDLNQKKQEATQAASKLNQEHEKLSGLVERREKLYASTHKDLDERTRAVKKISAQARNLQDLVKKLDKEKEQRKAKAPKNRVVKSLPAPGKAQLPISGIIRIGYNDSDAFGAPSKGISIEGIGGALIVAPMGGVVRFTGPFKNYGNMIILEHKNGYHSLIAGFEKLDTVVGQSVSAGEPLGLLHYTINGQKPALYYELRHKGKPVNPSIKLAGLG